MLLGNAPDQKANFKDKQSKMTRPDLAGESDVHAKLAVEQHSKKPREAVNPSTTSSKSHWKQTTSEISTSANFFFSAQKN